MPNRSGLFPASPQLGAWPRRRQRILRGPHAEPEMPRFIVTLIETLTHRVVVDAVTEVAAMHAAEVFLMETDHKDDDLFVASGFEATETEAAAVDALPDVKEKA
jgi:hypothetical protein